MNRISRTIALMATLVLLAMTVGLVGCSNSASTVATGNSNLFANSLPAKSPIDNGMSLGYFQFVFGDDGTVSVEDATPVRGAEINVMQWASIVIENFFFDENERNWHVTATIKNISPLTGYDVLAVFHSLGNKFVANPDGFIWAMPPIFPDPTRCAFLAYGKKQTNRVYPPMFQDTREIIIHQPEGVPKLAPLGFWIEAYARPRQFPGVEDLKVEQVDATTAYHLTGYVWDHQSPSTDLTVFADCTKFNGVNNVPMFDDGAHGDGAAGDNIFGCDFTGAPPDGLYIITVYAYDPQQNKGENDVGFWVGAQVPCDKPFEHYKYGPVDHGEYSGISYLNEAVINDPDTWEKVWAEHKSNQTPQPPVPPIDFKNNTVIGVWIGSRPTNNHMVHIKDIYLDPCEELVTILYDYSPYESCGPLDVITDPYDIVVLPKFKWPVYFVGTQVGCPPPPPECVQEIKFETIVHGTYSGIHDPYEKVINNNDEYNNLWKHHTSTMFPPPEKPFLDFPKVTLIATGLGDRPTGGFECNIEKICFIQDQNVGVFYTERIPGKECLEPFIVMQPCHWVVIPKNSNPVKFFHNPVIYDCGGPDCEEPQIFVPIDQGQNTGHPAVEGVFKDPDSFGQFWNMHRPDAPQPPVDFKTSMVLAMLVGSRPSSGYAVETMQVCLNHNPDGGLRMDINYVEHQPGENCQVLWVMTAPYQIVVVPRFDGPTIFHNKVDVYNCPPNDECKPMMFQLIEDGSMSCDEMGQYGFQGFGDNFTTHWWNVHCWEPGDPGSMPGTPGAEPGMQWVPFEIQLAHKPTTGFFVTVTDVCIKGCDVFVKYTENIPGEGCPVGNIVTKPWTFQIAQLPMIDCEYQWHFEGTEFVYKCDDPCVPAPVYPLVDGDKSCAEPGEHGWQGGDGYEGFWKQVHCQVPDMPPLPIDPEPTQGGIIYHIGIQLGELPTTGYYLTIDKVCVIGCDVYVDYTQNIPGETCPVEQVGTKPWIVSAIELPAVYCEWTWHFTKHEVVYQCK